MDSTLLHIVLATLVAGALSVAAAAGVSYFLLGRWIRHLVGFAVGAMLGTALLNLLPEAMEAGLGVHDVGLVMLLGLAAFFVLEASVRGPDGPASRVSPVATAAVVVVCDGLHNFVDGVLIATAFLLDPALGTTTTIAIVAHEIPQEVGDFVILLESGISKAAAFAWNVASSLSATAGGVIAYFILLHAREFVPYALAVGAAGFLYLAIASLVPLVHAGRGFRGAALQFVLMAAGVVSISAGTHSH